MGYRLGYIILGVYENVTQRYDVGVVKEARIFALYNVCTIPYINGH